jgi:uncharacterized membrane protein YkoI
MQPLRVVMALSLTVVLGIRAAATGQEMKFSDGPAAVRKTFEAEAKGSRIETIHKEKAEDDTVYWAEVTIAGKAYAIGVLEDGTLTEMNLAIAEDQLAFDQCPAAVQATFRREAFGEKVESVGKDVKYGVPIYEAAVKHRGRSYEVVVAEDGTLVEKVLVIADEEIELAKCPATVQAALKAHARGGTIGDVTRSTGIGRPTFEAEVKIKDKVYLIEVAETGSLISKSLEAGEE